MIAISAAILASGFAIPEQGAAALGQSNAFVARADDASAVYYNPAGLAGQKGLRIDVGDTLILPTISADLTGSYSGVPVSGTWAAQKKLFFPPQLYVSYGGDSWGAGIGVNAPFGLGVFWPDRWAGQYDTQLVNLQIIEIAPAIAYSIGPVRLGASLRYLTGSIEYQQGINFYSNDFKSGLGDLVGAGSGLGFSLGAQASLMDKKLDVGLNYRSRTTMTFDGQIHYSGVPGTFAGYIHDGPAHATTRLPDQVMLGVSYRVSDPLTVSLQGDYTAWQLFDEFHATLDAYCAPGAPCKNEIKSPRNWHHTLTGRLGGEYRLSEKYRARAGVFYDQGASPEDTLSASLPESSRVGGSLGFGFDLAAGVGIDLGVTYAQFFSITSNPDGSVPGLLPATYHANALLFGVGVNYGGRGR